MPPQPASHMDAIRNGNYWNTFWVKGTLSPIDSLNLSATSFTDNPGGINPKADTLNFKILYHEKGTYTLHSNQVFYGTFANDVLTGYQLDTTYNNQIVITGFDVYHNGASTNPDMVKLSGTFSLKFIDPKNSTGINFVDAHFYTLIER